MLPPTDGLDVSVIMPCLNEAEGVGACVAAAWEALHKADLRGEVIVVDNGSTDGSGRIAAAGGARVINEDRRGYGRACLAGLRAASGAILILGDADCSYDFGELPALLRPLHAGADLVLGSRFRGVIHPRAMPFHRRYVGNPALTLLVNALFGLRLTDAESGFRAMTRGAFAQLRLTAPGMEFAPEMVIAARRAGLRLCEVPISYFPRRGRSKLRPLVDGWRQIGLMMGAVRRARWP